MLVSVGLLKACPTKLILLDTHTMAKGKTASHAQPVVHILDKDMAGL
jgi:hypothetical protein